MISKLTGSEIEPAFTLNASESFRKCLVQICEANIFVQDIFGECKSIDKKIEFQSACFSVV